GFLLRGRGSLHAGAENRPRRCASRNCRKGKKKYSRSTRSEHRNRARRHIRHISKEARRPLGSFRRLAQRTLNSCNSKSQHKGENRTYRASNRKCREVLPVPG